jgi:hypothetical protein
MFAVRLVGTNKWIMRTPGHSRVVDHAGSTWSIPPNDVKVFYNQEVEGHIKQLEKVPSITASKLFYRQPSKYLEVVKIAFVEVP